MPLDWSDLFGAFALLLILEGLLPFANPSGLKRGLARLLELEDRELRIGGLGAMLVGLLLLFIVRS